jgi:soluble lytic murein transglycosylase
MAIASRVAGLVVLGIAAFWALGMERPGDEIPIVLDASVQGGWSERDLWLAPPVDPAEPSIAAQGVARLAADDPAGAVPLLSSVDDPALRPYAQLHLTRAYLALEQYSEAADAAREVLSAAPPDGYLGDTALGLLADALEKGEAWAQAFAVRQRIANRRATSTASAWFALGRAAERVGESDVARQAYARVYFEWPASSDADEARRALERMGAFAAESTLERAVSRADRLFEANRWSDAWRAYQAVLPRLSGADRDRVQLRFGIAEVRAGRHGQGLERLTAYLERPGVPDKDEAAFFCLAALRGLGRADYPGRVDRFVSEFGSSRLAEAALNDLATHYIVTDQDAKAVAVFDRMLDQFPGGAFADRAAWRAGWWAYRHDDYRAAIERFEPAAMAIKRADYRPAWLYWTGKSYAAIGEPETARTWYLRTIADYRNSYFGRLAADAFMELAGRYPQAAEVAAFRDPARAIAPGSPPAGFDRIRPLLDASLWIDAVAEMVTLQPQRGADPVIEATIAYALNRNGELRPAITAMRRAYPQFMSDGGEALPERMLRVIFPVAYADTISRLAAERGLDVYLVTALIAQESTFQADVRSSASAVGLMQLITGTARRYAARAGVGPFHPSMLTDPIANVSMGTAYLSDLLKRYGGNEAAALAAYNAGENRVDRWRAERPGIPTDEFVDDIPYPETQNYVRRILGTVHDYRKLYELD